MHTWRLALLIAWLAGQGQAADLVLSDVYRIYSTGCPSGANYAGTGFRIAGLEGIFSSLHTVNNCATQTAVSTSRKEADLRLQVCRVAVRFDVAVLDTNCSRNYSFPFASPVIDDERLYVIGYPVQAGKFRRPVFLFKHEERSTTRLDSLGLDSDIFGLEKGVWLAPDTPVVVVGSGIAPGDSGAPLVTRQNKVVGIVGGGRREASTGGLVGITWAVALGPELARQMTAPDHVNVKDALWKIARKPVAQLFGNDALKRQVNGVEFAEVHLAPEPEPAPVLRYWVMTAEASRKEYRECVRSGACSSGPRYDIAAPDRPALIDNIADARQFCKWLGGTPLNRAVWTAAAGMAPGAPSPYQPCKVNLKGFAGCSDKQQPIDVRSTEANQSGFHDLFGNVWEWLDTADGSGEVAGGAFNTPHNGICSEDGDCKGAFRGRARAGTIGVRCMAPIVRPEDSRSEESGTR